MNILDTVGKEISLDRLLAEDDERRGVLRPLLQFAADVPDCEPSFVWKNRFPCQQGLLAGIQGAGKSLLCAWLAAQLTQDNVDTWPDGSPCPTGAVLWFSPEGGEGLTARRLRSLGADVRKIAFYSGLWSGRRDTDGEPLLEMDAAVSQVREIQRAIDRVQTSTGAPVRLIIIDPICDAMEGVDQYKAAEVSRALKPLDRIAVRNNLCVLAVSHLRKSGGENSMYAIQGSNAFSSKSRFAYVFQLHPDTRREELSGMDEQQPKKLVLSLVKSNDFFQRHSVELELTADPLGIRPLDCFSPLTADGVAAELAKLNAAARKPARCSDDLDSPAATGRPVSEARREAFELFTDGKSQQDVQELLGVSRSTSRYWYGIWRATKSGDA